MEKIRFDYEKANQLAGKYMTMGYHCSEAATRALLEVLYGSADPMLIKVSTPFMGGIAGTQQQVCGAISGSLIVLGSLYGRSEADVNDDFLAQIGKELLQNFTNHCGANSIICQELRERRAAPSCTPYVQCAVVETLKLIEKYNGEPQLTNC
ncbi:MAG: C-GCAxxG-C-C family protein [Anaerolineae bacterium]|nr:C-GCAxxG-C-C family protein [Anaerolineae bacterium]